MNRLFHASAVAGLLLVSACSDDSKDSAGTEATNATTVADTTSDTTPDTVAPTTLPAPVALNAREIVEALASDDLGGRDNLTEFSAQTQSLLIDQVAQFAQPVYAADGADGYLQRFADGANILAMVPFISRRSTTMSIMPCSSRNSLR